MFDLKEWSHPLVLQQTLEKAHELNYKIGLVEELNDIDTLEDLRQTDLKKKL